MDGTYKITNELIVLHGVPDRGLVYMDARTAWLWITLQLPINMILEMYPEHNTLYEGKLFIGDLEKDFKLYDMFRNQVEERRDYGRIV